MAGVDNKVYNLQEVPEERCTYLKLVPEGSRVLEFGPATGYMTRYLRDKKGCRVTGFEYSPESAALSARYCEQMVVGDVEQAVCWRELKPPYDVVLFADLLEHLRHPEDVLARSKDLLTPDGCVLISIPNIAHWTIRMSLLQGRFDYMPTGLLDNTHLRFFTRRTLQMMIENAGYYVTEWDAWREYPQYKRLCRIRMGLVAHLLNRLMDRLWPDASIYQFFVCCRPTTKTLGATEKSAHLDAPSKQSVTVGDPLKIMGVA